MQDSPGFFLMPTYFFVSKVETEISLKKLAHLLYNAIDAPYFKVNVRRDVIYVPWNQILTNNC